MSWIVTPQLKVLNGVTQESILGISFGGGFFGGYISHTANGVPTHALIVAPAAVGATGTGYTLTTDLAWKTANTSTPETTSDFDGAANTQAIVNAGIANHPAAEFCVNLSIGGFTDWYLPARSELDIVGYNLKPETTNNSINWGTNSYSVPRRDSNNSAKVPGQTLITLFQAGGGQEFQASAHWSSTQGDNERARQVNFNDLSQNSIGQNKTTTLRVRAFRRIAL